MPQCPDARAGDRPGRPLRGGQVAPRRPSRAAGAAARRLLQGRRRPDAAASSTWRVANPSSTGTIPASWNADDAVTAVEELCRTGSTDAPVYDIAANGRTGHRVLELDGSAYFVAEGIFAQEIVTECRRRDLLADALCVTQHPLVTFVRRLSRDLREHRKPPFYLVRRGLHLLADQPAVVANAERLGCRVLSPEDAYRDIQRLVEYDAAVNPVAVTRALFWRVQRPVVDRARAYVQKVQLWRARNVAPSAPGRPTRRRRGPARARTPRAPPASATRSAHVCVLVHGGAADAAGPDAGRGGAREPRAGGRLCASSERSAAPHQRLAGRTQTTAASLAAALGQPARWAAPAAQRTRGVRRTAAVATATAWSTRPTPGRCTTPSAPRWSPASRCCSS